MSGPWFAPKRFGYGTGLPIRWQGWATIAVYFAMLYAAQFAVMTELTGTWRIVGIAAAVIVPTVIFGFVAYAKTDGGWHWRNGE